MAAVIPWALLGLGIQYKLVNNNSMHYFPMWAIDLLLNATPGFTVLSYVFYEWWKRVANSKIYSFKNDAWWRVLEYPILGSIALFGFSVPTFLIASFAVLCTQTEYRVAEKHAQKHNLHLHNPVVDNNINNMENRENININNNLNVDNNNMNSITDENNGTSKQMMILP